MKKVETRREKIYTYICERINQGFSPTVREICRDLQIISTSTVHSDLKSLRDAGYIDMTGNLNRSIKLPGEPTARVPLVGAVAAGKPILALQNIEQYINVSLPAAGFRKLFALRVKGDSMINAAILDGDIVVVEQTPSAENGWIVVAMVGDEATVKRFYKENGRFRLQPENDSMQPIIVDDVTILGRVLAVHRYYI